MIVLLNRENQAAFEAACALDPIFGAQLLTDLAIYGGNTPAVGFWVAIDENDTPTAAISRIQGRMMVAAGQAPLNSELAAFIRSVGGWRQLRANATICEQMDRWGELFTAPSMVYCGPPFGADRAGLAVPGLPQLYKLLCTGLPDFAQGKGWDGWYAMASHLFRHKLGYALGVCRDGQLASTAGVYAMSEDVGVIACVATLEPYRGRGYAGLLVRCLCDELLAEGKTPMLQCGDDALASYYRAMGFVARNRWGKVVRRDTMVGG